MKKLTHPTFSFEWILESILIIVLIILTTLMFIRVDKIQGTARVVNYAGIIRGGTQRLVKLELLNQPNDELLNYLNEILNGLENGGSSFNLIEINSQEYQTNLQKVSDFWQDLQATIIEFRQNPNQEKLLAMSETYFILANNLVASAENYSQENATLIGRYELYITIDLILILGLLIKQTIQGVTLHHTNNELSKSAYTDTHTGLPNKNKCESILNQSNTIEEPTCCIMFDLNGLKHVNDTLGHLAGDVLILSFANQLRNCIPNQHFVGRYGGDEFIAILKNIPKEEIELLLHNIDESISQFNKTNGQLILSYACGYAYSQDYPEPTLKDLLEKADSMMYIDKKNKKENQK